MPQMVVGCPLEIFEVPDKLRPQPSAFFHLFSRESLAPPAGLGFWQVRERTLINFQRTKASNQCGPQRGCETVAGPCHIYQPFFLVIPEDNGVERSTSNGVSADDKVLCPVNPHLLPCAGPFGGLVTAISMLRNKALEAVGLYRVNQIRKTGFERTGIAHGFSQLRQNLVLQ